MSERVASERIGDLTGRSGDTVGTFLICCALLAFEISTVRTINFAIGPSYIFIAIALAMMGLTAAGALLSLIDLNALRLRRAPVLAWLCLMIAGLLVLANILVVNEKTAINDMARAAGEAQGVGGLISLFLTQSPFSALKVGAFLSLPYFLFGALLSYLFATSRTADYARLYGADLLGAAFGCAAIVVIMETTEYAVSVMAPAICAALAAAAYAATQARVVALGAGVAAIVLSIATQSGPFRLMIEPQADPNYLVRDYKVTTKRTEVWSAWNSYTRVGAVEAANAPGKAAVLSLANGDGMAFLFPYDPDSAAPLVHRPVIPALLTGPADSALVLFAGAGGDLMSLRDHGVSAVTGVELNGRLVEAGHALPDYRLAEFLALDGVELIVDEARSFLETDKRRYDLVLFSWSGATIVYHLGALGGTTQHVFTYEGVSAALDHVAPGGRAVILQVNKVDMLAALRRYMAERGLENPERSAIILFSVGMANDWSAPWDENPLLVKLDGWTDEEIAEISRRAAENGLYQIAYAPGIGAHEDYQVYERLLTTDDVGAEIATISAVEGVSFGYATDDKPFYLDHFDPARYLDLAFWRGSPEALTTTHDVYHRMRVVFVVALSGVSFLLAILPLLLARRTAVSRGRASVFLGYFMALGAGFMFVEIALIQKIGVLMADPGQAIAVVLCLIILSTGVGSLLSNRVFAAGLGFRSCSLLVAIYALIAAGTSSYLVDAALGQAMIVKLAVIAALIAPGGFLMGQLFPQGVALAGDEDKSLTPWAWAINGAMSASIAGIAPLVAQIVGFNALLVIGAALYALVALLPLESRRAAAV